MKDYLEAAVEALNESPSEKEGKYAPKDLDDVIQETLNESPSEKEGKSATVIFIGTLFAHPQ